MGGQYSKWNHSLNWCWEPFHSFIFLFLAALRGMRDLGPRPGMEPAPPVVEAWSPNHWTARGVSPSPNSFLEQQS